jgi:Rad17 cell cycle checkpoint protein
MQRLLILTGPAGSGKTATLRVLAREMDFDIVEYKDNTNTTRFSTFADEPLTRTSEDIISLLFFLFHVPNWRSRYSRSFYKLSNARGRIHVNIHTYASKTRAC